MFSPPLSDSRPVDFTQKQDLCLLRGAARLWAVQASYYDNTGNLQWTLPDTLLQMLYLLTGVRVQTRQQFRELRKLWLQRRYQERKQGSMVSWGNSPLPLWLTFLGEESHLVSRCQNGIFEVLALDQTPALTLDLANTSQATWHLKPVQPHREGYRSLRLQISRLNLAEGNYTFVIRSKVGESEIRANKILTNEHLTATDSHKVSESEILAQGNLVVAPQKLAPHPVKTTWGAFLPLYALRSSTDWGIGSVRELLQASRFLASKGAGFVSVLPLLAQDFDGPDPDPSPYSALTRFFWNEIHLDMNALLAELPSRKVETWLNQTEVKQELENLRASALVDYKKVYARIKNTLLLLMEEHPEQVQKDIEVLEREVPVARAYAKFRAKKSKIKNDENFHLWAQALIRKQLKKFSADSPCLLYMDYPIGVNDSGFDFAHFPAAFFAPVSVGAPPEPMFPLGQDWGFPSFHPHHHQQVLEYFRQSLSAHMEFCKILRLDHILGLYRIYSVPKGANRKGAFLRFSQELLFGELCLQAQKHNVAIIGENLGTVPPQVNEILRERGLYGMSIFHCETTRGLDAFTAASQGRNLGAINTHDMPQFAAWWNRSDIPYLQSLGILSPELAQKLDQQRELDLGLFRRQVMAKKAGSTPPSLQEAYHEVLRELLQSKCQFAVVNLEDFWSEQLAQNIPGTWKEAPNWRRKFRYSIEEWENFQGSTQVWELLNSSPRSRNSRQN